MFSAENNAFLLSILFLGKCSVLREYREFVETVRKHKEAREQEYFRKAIDECIKRGILKEYLERKGSEVLNMLIAEYDYDLDIEVQREEAYEDGIEKGIQTGTIRGMKAKLVEQIRKKVKSILEIAQELEETPEEVEKIIKEYGLVQ